MSLCINFFFVTPQLLECFCLEGKKKKKKIRSWYREMFERLYNNTKKYFPFHNILFNCLIITILVFSFD